MSKTANLTYHDSIILNLDLDFYLTWPNTLVMPIIKQVERRAKEIKLNDSEIDRVIDVLLPIVREKFEGMQFPTIEIYKEDGIVKLKASYTFQ